ncbi:hypothetical protein OUZ56_011621 [Daphnia magna]|uniref:Uncharacterized protein n=1 Tax=Daphnia magna TaxID=35525 RepID=A0ABQ9Z0M3_9CRUS|nr:hypothetical protein OUZ56_011621 [Daphnia magna]
MDEESRVGSRRKCVINYMRLVHGWKNIGMWFIKTKSIPSWAMLRKLSFNDAYIFEETTEEKLDFVIE